MTLLKEEVLGIITTQPNGNIEEKNFKKKFPELYQEIINLNFPSEFKFTQKLYHYFYDDPDLKLGLCPVCGKRCEFLNFNKGYSKHCSIKCSKNNYETQLKYEKTCQEKYGVKNVFKSEEIKEKIKQTNLKKYGVENYSQTIECWDKIRKTEYEKYVVEHHTQSKICQEKRIKTCLNKYGSKTYTQSEDYKKNINNIVEKQIQTNLKKYGVEYYSQTNEFSNKYKNTCLEKYNVPHYNQSDEYKIKIPKILEKYKHTCQEKYGVNRYSQTEESKEKYINTCQNKWGVDYYFQTEEQKEKSRNTCLEKYGVDYYSQTHDFSVKNRKRISYDNLTFDSSWEVEVYKFCKENNIPCEYQPNIRFEYEHDGKKHIYQPDFLINDKIYEVKGDHFFENDKMINPYDRTQDGLYESKHQCMIKNKVVVLKDNDIKDLKNSLIIK